MPTYHGGRHEYGQNFLTDPKVIHKVVTLVEPTAGPIIEIGPGGGALTGPLLRLGRELTGIEIDARQVRRLAARLPGPTLLTGDFLHYQLPDQPHVIVGNLPFHITTAVLRKLLHSGGWTQSILIVQWEVARRRAGVGGATMMTAQWWPWMDFTVHGRIPGAAFTPSPGVDAGILAITRRADPLLPWAESRAYRAFIYAMFTGKGSGIREISTRVIGGRRAGVLLQRWLAEEGIRPSALPKTLNARQWTGMFALAGELGWRPRH